MKRSLSFISLLTFLLLGIANFVFSQSVIGTWDKLSGPGDPIRYKFLDDSTVIILSVTRIDTADYKTYSIPNTDIREIDLGKSGVVGWRGIYTVSAFTLGIEGYWYTGLPPVSTPNAFKSATLYQRVISGKNINKIEIPQSFVLLLSNPDRFNPAITIRLSIPERDFITLNVYDSRGIKTRTLLNDVYNAGSYRLLFDAKEFKNGVYFFQCNVGNRTFTKQMHLIK
jgi:hypothetical protein